MRRLFGLFAILFAATSADALDSAVSPQDAPAQPAVIIAHAIAMYDDPKYPADFTHFDYVNPDAPKGGTLRQVAIGTYDSFNGFIRKGDAAGLAGLYESLMVSSLDEPFTEYGLLAETIEYPEDRSWVIFNLRPEAKWHDGVPITADDVVWTFEFLTTKGHPQFAFYYQSVVGVEKLGERRIKFSFAPGDNRELPLIMGQMTVLPKHYWTAEGRSPEETTLEPPLGSGPYQIGKFEAGRYVEMVRAKNYWGKDLAINRGQDNFDVIRTAYVRDQLIARQMLKAGEVDYYLESQAKAWALDYDIPAVTDGRLIKEKFPDTKSGSMQNFTFNTRREIFKDRRVRLAISQAMDFEWMNKNFFFGEYVRPNSYFFPTELASSGLPSADELAILEPYRDRLPPEVFTEVYQPPTTDGSGWPRANLLKAVELLKDAGWEIQNMKLVNAASGEPMRFEILLYNQLFERVALAFKRNLTKLGIEVSVRMVDTSQYIERLDNYDFDMVIGGLGQSISPGNEQRGYWTSAAADVVGGQNLPGIKDPVVDELVDLLIASPTRHDLVMRTRALDRVLLWGHYVIPQWDAPFTRVIYWDRFGKPEGGSFDGFNIGAWWVDPAKDAALTSTTTTAASP